MHGRISTIAESPVGAAYRRAPGIPARSDDRGRSRTTRCKSVALTSAPKSHDLLRRPREEFPDAAKAGTSPRACVPDDLPGRHAVGRRAGGGTIPRQRENFRGNQRRTSPSTVSGNTAVLKRSTVLVPSAESTRRAESAPSVVCSTETRVTPCTACVMCPSPAHATDMRTVRSVPKRSADTPNRGRFATSRRLPSPEVHMSIDTNHHSCSRVNSSSLAAHRSGGISTRVTKQSLLGPFS
jgi:hypothetical protein